MLILQSLMIYQQKQNYMMVPIYNAVARYRKIVDAVGYHAANILYEIEYCDPGSLNLVIPPENLHTVQLGLSVQQLQGFGRTKQFLTKTTMYLQKVTWKKGT